MIEISYTIKCDSLKQFDCEYYLNSYFIHKIQLFEYARKMGWKYTRKVGWVCPACQKQLDNK